LEARLRPIAWSSVAFFCTGTVLVSTHDRAVDHRVFVVRVGCQVLKDPLPHTRVRPATVPAARVVPITKALRQVAPRYPGPEAIEHRLDEQPVIFAKSCGDPDSPQNTYLATRPSLVVGVAATDAGVGKGYPQLAGRLALPVWSPEA
jgi:hypothetical protein